MNHIYVVFSATPYRLGRAIRRLTGEAYNHASIALDSDLNRMYSFARRFYRTPLYGGFVKESHARYHVGSKVSQICICKIPVSQEQYAAIDTKLTAMHNRADHYIYNHISALGGLLHKRVPAKDAYTCVEFCNEILNLAGMHTPAGKYQSLGSLWKLLQPYAVYTGPIPKADSFDETYFSKKPLASPVKTTLQAFCKLFPRVK